MEPTAHRVDVGRVIGEAFETYRANLGVLLGAAVIVFGIAGLINGFLSREGALLALVATVVSMIAHALFTGYVVKLVQDVRDGRRDDTVGELFSAAAPYIGTLILIGILFGIAVGVGLLLLIVPGLFLITIWAVVAPAAVVENRGVLGSFGRSRELVRGSGWSVFGTIVVAFLILFAASIVLGAIGAGIGEGAGVVANVIASVLVAPIPALVASIIFFDLGGGSGVAPAPTAEPGTAPGAPQ